MSPQDIAAARKHMASGLRAHQVAKMYGITERSLWRTLRWASEQELVRDGGVTNELRAGYVVKVNARGKGAALRINNLKMDTSTPTGKLMLKIMLERQRPKGFTAGASRRRSGTRR